MYVDAYVIQVPKKNLAKSKKGARLMCKVWVEHGALECHENVADDVQPGKRTSYPQAVKLKKGETIIAGFAVYKSRAHRDRVNKKAMSDPRLMKMFSDSKAMPFDGKQMFWGGFKRLVSG